MRPVYVAVLILLITVLLLCAVPPPSEADSPHQSATNHTVASGETLSAIANRYGTSVQAIMQANGLSGSMIRQGQSLYIPAAGNSGSSTSGSTTTWQSPSGSASGGGGYHVVRSGETLSSIAARYGVSVAALKQANGLVGDVIIPGQGLSIPSGSSPSYSRVTPSAPPSTRSAFSSRSSCGSSYRVQRGDTLSGIAARCGVSLAALRQANGLTTSTIRSGQFLTIPGSSYNSTRTTVATPAPPSSWPTPTYRDLPTPESPYPPWRYESRGASGGN